MKRPSEVSGGRRGHGGKWLLNALVVAAIFLAPLSGSAGSLTHLSPYIAALLWWVVLVSQPSLRPREMAHDEGDARSAALIALCAFVSQLIAVADFALQTPGDRPAVGVIVAGTLVGCAGLFLRVWAIATLGKFFSSTVEIRSDHKVVTWGPYRLLRHPSYTGALMIWTGVPLLLGSVRGVIAASALGIAAYAWRICVEERVLTRAMGEAYVEYSRRTWRLVPFVH